MEDDPDYCYDCGGDMTQCECDYWYVEEDDDK